MSFALATLLCKVGLLSHKDGIEQIVYVPEEMLFTKLN